MKVHALHSYLFVLIPLNSGQVVCLTVFYDCDCDCDGGLNPFEFRAGSLSAKAHALGIPKAS